MPAFIPPVHYVEIITYATAVARGGDTKRIQNIYHFRRTTTTNPVDPAHIEAAFQAGPMAAVLAGLSVDYTQTRTTVRYFEDADHAPVSFTEAGVGAIAATRNTTFQAALIVFHTRQRGQSGMGKKYFGPIAEVDALGDTLTAPGLALIVAIGTAIMAGFTDADGNVWKPGIKGGPRRGIVPAPQYRVNPTLTVWNDFTSFVANKSFTTQRRRRIHTVS